MFIVGQNNCRAWDINLTFGFSIEPSTPIALLSKDTHLLLYHFTATTFSEEQKSYWPLPFFFNSLSVARQAPPHLVSLTVPIVLFQSWILVVLLI